MQLMSILSGKGFVMYNKALAHSVSVNGAIIFGQLCSSYESFESKSMLKDINGRAYFFLTGEVIKQETSLTYKQQLKAIKELEQAGFIETRIMGVPSKKYFHITNKIVQELHLLEGIPSSAKRSKLNVSTVEDDNSPDPRYDKRSTLGMLKGHSKPLQKGSAIKKKNKKEQDKDNNELLVNKRDEIVNNLWKQFSLKGMNKELFFRVLAQIELQEKEGTQIDDFERYSARALHTALNRSEYKRGLKEPPRINIPGLLDYDWLNEDSE